MIIVPTIINYETMIGGFPDVNTRKELFYAPRNMFNAGKGNYDYHLKK